MIETLTILTGRVRLDPKYSSSLSVTHLGMVTFTNYTKNMCLGSQRAVLWCP